MIWAFSKQCIYFILSLFYLFEVLRGSWSEADCSWSSSPAGGGVKTPEVLLNHLERQVSLQL